MIFQIKKIRNMDGNVLERQKGEAKESQTSTQQRNNQRENDINGTQHTAHTQIRLCIFNHGVMCMDMCMQCTVYVCMFVQQDTKRQAPTVGTSLVVSTKARWLQIERKLAS